jgi:hypothetical protein
MPSLWFMFVAMVLCAIRTAAQSHTSNQAFMTGQHSFVPVMTPPSVQVPVRRRAGRREAFLAASIVEAGSGSQQFAGSSVIESILVATAALGLF